MYLLNENAQQHLRHFGLNDELIAKLAAEYEIVFHFNHSSRPVAMIQLFDGFIRFGIISIKDKEEGSKAFNAFLKRSYAIAKSQGCAEFELCGVALYNIELRTRLFRKRFKPSLESAPLDIGNQLKEFLIRRFKVHQFR